MSDSCRELPPEKAVPIQWNPHAERLLAALVTDPSRRFLCRGAAEAVARCVAAFHHSEVPAVHMGDVLAATAHDVRTHRQLEVFQQVAREVWS